MSVKMYRDFESFLASTKNDDEFSFFGIFDDPWDLFKTAYILLKNDDKREVSITCKEIRSCHFLLENFIPSSATRDVVDKFTNALLGTSIKKLRQNEILIVDDTTRWLERGDLKLIEDYSTTFRHRRNVFLLLVSSADKKSFFKKFSHLQVWKAGDRSCVTSVHKHFLSDGELAWKTT